MKKNFDIITVLKDYPDEDWLNRVRRNSWVFLVKSTSFAVVEWEYEPPGPAHNCGRIGIRPIWRSGDEWGLSHSESWFIRPSGRGIDYSQLMLPIEGHLADTSNQREDPETLFLRREIDRLNEQLRSMHSRVSTLELGMLYMDPIEN